MARIVAIAIFIWCEIAGLGQEDRICKNIEYHLYPAIDSAIQILQPNPYARIIVCKVVELKKNYGEFSLTYIYSFSEHWAANPSHYIEYKGFIILFRTEHWDSIFSLCTNFPRYGTLAKKIIRKYSNDNITAQTPDYCLYKYKRKKSYITRWNAYKLEDKYMYYNPLDK